MKKLLTLWALLFALLLASCDDNDVAVVEYPTEEVYVSQMTETAGGVSTTYTYVYEGNKITSVTDTQGGERVYRYVNDLLTREDIYLNDILTEYTVFGYKANKKLAQATHIISNGDGTWTGIRMAFTYNTDDTLTTTLYQGNQNGQYDFIAAGIVTYTDGNITGYSQTPEDEDDTDEIVPNPVVTVLAYNSEKAPFKNVFGYDALCLAGLEGGVNVLASSITTVIVPATEEGEEDEEIVTAVNYTYQYNENGYPTQQTSDNGITRMYTYVP
ncbi:MAG: hypothetical protein V4581_06265 [Bacteroidota bacterium]